MIWSRRSSATTLSPRGGLARTRTTGSPVEIPATRRPPVCYYHQGRTAAPRAFSDNLHGGIPMGLLKCLLVPVAAGLLGAAPPDRKPAPGSGAPKAEPISAKHYRICDARGRPATLEDLLRRMEEVDVVFLGESHDDP